MEKNWLKLAADAYNTLMRYDYIFHLGTSKRKIIISVVTANAEEFSHVSGLDHLIDIKEVSSKNVSQKIKIFKRIIAEEITYSDIVHSQYLKKPFSDEAFTIDRRIKDLANIVSYIETDSKNGKFYKWNRYNSRIKEADGVWKRSMVNADYVLSIPVDDKADIHIFLKQTNKNAPVTEPIRLFMISMFAAAKNYVNGQERFGTILALVRQKVEKSKCVELRKMYCRDIYEKELDEYLLPFQKDLLK